jgi:putative chitinase
MPFDKRATRHNAKPPGTGPYLAEITNNQDPTRMGRLEVVVVDGVLGSLTNQAETFIAKYASPFQGTTSVRWEGNDPKNFNDVQKSYGFWMVPPDVGCKVLIIFVNQDPNQCYWIGCVQDSFQNHMIPGIASSEETDPTAAQLLKYDTKNLPVAEFNKLTELNKDPNIDKKKKPVHPFADRLLAQGLLFDNIRGITSSSARRESPSTVFGISTPGPMDPNGPKKPISRLRPDIQTSVSRLGGSTFVMDDGDANGQNELVRIRTRTGHQILLHNSADLIYIANAAGTAWIELTKNGKIDIYAADSVSIHTKGDFNLRADRDFNLEAGRKFNVSAGSGDINMNSGGNFNLLSNAIRARSFQDISLTSDTETKLAVGSNFGLAVTGDLNILTSGTTNVSSLDQINIISEQRVAIKANSDLAISAGDSITASSPIVDLNGTPAISPSTPIPFTVEIPPPLNFFSVPQNSPEKPWPNVFYKSDPITSIMVRVPTSEPWHQHESANAASFTLAKTDATIGTTIPGNIGQPKPVFGSVPKYVIAGTGSPPSFAGQSANTTPSDSFVPDVSAKDKQKAAQIAAAGGKGQAALKKAASQLGMTGPQAVAALLGITGGESAWQIQSENFNYKADRLIEVFPSIFGKDPALAQRYSGNPNNSLPELLYGYQSPIGKKLGNTNAGDGSKYIGRGFIQLTGRSNYTRYSQLMYANGFVPKPTTLLDEPDALNSIIIAAQVSVIYLLDRVKTDQMSDSYFSAALKAVGYNTPDILAKKTSLYQYFLEQLGSQQGVLTSGNGSIVTDSQGNPIRTGKID